MSIKIIASSVGKFKHYRKNTKSWHTWDMGYSCNFFLPPRGVTAVLTPLSSGRPRGGMCATSGPVSLKAFLAIRHSLSLISHQTRIGEGNGTPLQYSCLENPMDRGAWWAAVHGVAKSQTRLSDFTFHFHALEKEMATHSRVLAWRIPGMGEPGRLLSLGSHRVRHD